MAVISGTGGPDDRDGTNDADTISLFNGNDVGRGLAGDDVIYGGSESDQLFGGDGNDNIFSDTSGSLGDPGKDSLYGGSGDDTLHGEFGETGDLASGGAGIDLLELNYFVGVTNDPGFFVEVKNVFSVIIGGVGAISAQGIERIQLLTSRGNDTVYGGDYDDIIATSLGNDSVRGGAGNDDLRLDLGDFWADGGTGIDTIAVDLSDRTTGFVITMTGGAFDVAGVGSARRVENVTIRGGQGDDRISTEDGTDNLAGGLGNDALFGGNGFNQLYGGDGTDTLTGGTGVDYLIGGTGDDVSFGGADNDLLQEDGFSGDGNDSLYGGAGIETIYAGDGNDLLDGGGDADYLGMGGGNDIAYGGNGADSFEDDPFSGLSGDDVMYGGADNDSFSLRGGSDRAFGGNGDDRFTVSFNTGTDRVEGGAGIDSLSVAGNSSSSAVVVARLVNGTYTVKRDGAVVLRAEAFESMTIQGGNLGDRIDGYSSNDYILGTASFSALPQPELDADRLDGRDGNDTLDGRFGKDTLTGGAGADQFLFGSTTHSGATIATADRITDFERGVDRIYLTSIDADIATPFVNDAFVRVAAFDGTAGQAVLDKVGKGKWLLELDTTGDGVADMALHISSQKAPLASDFDW